MNQPRSSRLLVAALIGLVLLFLLALGGWLAYRAGRPKTVAGSAGTTAPTPKIHVGVVFSRHTAEADNSGHGPVGWERMYRICTELRAPDIEVRPIVDPGTGQDQDAIDACRMFFGPGASPIDGGDDTTLGALDVIVASHVTHLAQPQVDSIERAVRGGTGFLMRMFFCQYEPGSRRPRCAGCSASQPRVIRDISHFTSPTASSSASIRCSESSRGRARI